MSRSSTNLRASASSTKPSASDEGFVTKLLFPATVFLSAFLLFLVQPLIGNAILPWFGGGAGVWTACMLVFQCLLFLGYVYAHLLSTMLSPRKQALVHGALLCVAALLLHVLPSPADKPSGSDPPAMQIVLLLLKTVGFPYFLLSTSGPLLQRWYATVFPSASAYRLYALSNLGSLAALFSYPFALERMLPLPSQALFWGLLFVVFVLAKGVCAWRNALAGNAYYTGLAKAEELSASSAVNSQTSAPSVAYLPSSAPSWGEMLLWFLLSFTPSLMLLATTNQVCLDVASIPFLWILPLSIYLISFILCFDSDRWYSRIVFTILMVATSWMMIRSLMLAQDASFAMQVGSFLSGLFACSMLCHGELARAKPTTHYLTRFYMIMSAGGAAGGVFVNLVAPRIFTSFAELNLAIAVTMCLAVWFWARSAYAIPWRYPISKLLLYRGGVALLTAAAAIAVVTLLVMEARSWQAKVLARVRNFYGVLRVTDLETLYRQDHDRALYHGRIQHGFQRTTINEPLLPGAYYDVFSGAGLALTYHAKERPRNLGVVGLGVGVLAYYADKDDHLTFFEIDNDVVRLAQDYFVFLKECRGKLDIILGDARFKLEDQIAADKEKFDVLAVDAFSGDAIPVHLLTKEAFAIYKQRLRPDGILAIHISNRHFDLEPVVKVLAADASMYAGLITKMGDDRIGSKTNAWVLLSSTESSLKRPEFNGIKPLRTIASSLWTDQRKDLLAALHQDITVKELMSPVQRYGNAMHFGLLAYNNKKFENAASAFQEALRIDPNDASAWSNLGNAIGQLGQRDNAIRCFEKAYSLNNRNWGAVNNLAAMVSQSNPARSKALLTRTLEYEPRNVDALQNLGNLLAQEGKLDEALDKYRKVLEVDPANEAASKYMKVVEQMKAAKDNAAKNAAQTAQ